MSIVPQGQTTLNSLTQQHLTHIGYPKLQSLKMENHNEKKTPSSKYHLSPIDLSKDPSSSHSLSSGMSPGLIRGLAGGMPAPSPKTPGTPGYYSHNLSAQEAAHSMSAYEQMSNTGGTIEQRRYFTDLPLRKLPAYLPPHRRTGGGGVQLFPQGPIAPPSQPATPDSVGAMDKTILRRHQDIQRTLASAQEALDKRIAEAQQLTAAMQQHTADMKQLTASTQQYTADVQQQQTSIAQSIGSMAKKLAAIQDHIIQQVHYVNIIREAESQSAAFITEHRKLINGQPKRFDGNGNLLENQTIRQNAPHSEFVGRLARLENTVTLANHSPHIPTNKQVPSMHLPKGLPGLQPSPFPPDSIPRTLPTTVVNNVYNFHGPNTKLFGNTVAGPSGSLVAPNPRDDVFGSHDRTMELPHHDINAPIKYVDTLRAPVGAPRPTRISHNVTVQQSQLALPFRSPTCLEEAPSTKPVGAVFNSITGKVEQFVHKFLLTKDVQPSNVWKERPSDHLFQECRDHVGHVGQTKDLLLSVESKTMLLTGVLMRMLHKTVLDGSLLDAFATGKTTQDYAMVWKQERNAAEGPSAAKDLSFRDDLAKQRSKLANEIVYCSHGFHKWLQGRSIQRAEEFMAVLGPIILNHNVDFATKELKHIMQEVYRLAARLRCERNYFSFSWADAKFPFNHEKMVHRNAQYVGQALNQTPSEHVVLCTVSPSCVEKEFVSEKVMNTIMHHKMQVFLGDRRGNLR